MKSKNQNFSKPNNNKIIIKKKKTIFTNKKLVKRREVNKYWKIRKNMKKKKSENGLQNLESISATIEIKLIDISNKSRRNSKMS